MVSNASTPRNPNFWICQCGDQSVRSLFELTCPACQTARAGRPDATQQQINDDADRLLNRSQLLRQARHQLPEQRPRLLRLLRQAA